MPDPPVSFGWHRDRPDHRDRSPSAPDVRRLLRGLGYKRGRVGLPPAADGREYFRAADLTAPAWCAARAAVTLAEYGERRASGRDRAGSVAFVHRAAAQIQGGDGEAVGLRAALRAVVDCGVPPARFWPDGPAGPPAGMSPPVSYLVRFRKACYVRLDTPGVDPQVLLRRVKVFLAGGFACALGFVVPGSVGGGPDVAVPTGADTLLGGRCAVVAGYDDRRRIRSARGALLIRPAWGAGWGEDGFGWLPFEYLTGGLSADVWTLLHPRWLKSGEFGWS